MYYGLFHTLISSTVSHANMQTSNLCGQNISLFTVNLFKKGKNSIVTKLGDEKISPGDVNSYDLISTTVPYPERHSTKTFLENKKILQCAPNFKVFLLFEGS